MYYFKWYALQTGYVCFPTDAITVWFTYLCEQGKAWM